METDLGLHTPTPLYKCPNTVTEGNLETLCFHSLEGRNGQKEANTINGIMETQKLHI